MNVASASAALPEFITEKGGHEAGMLMPIPGPITLSTTKGERLKCSSGFMDALFTGPSTLREKMRFEHCETYLFGWHSCHNYVKGSETGVETGWLAGRLGYISKASKTVGVELEGEAGGETPIFLNEIECPEHVAIKDATVTGHLIGKITPVNSLTGKLTFTYNVKGGLQEITGFEGGPFERQLNWKWEPTFSPEPVGLAMTATGELDGAGGSEIKGFIVG
ncbi:MAG TPA: hypothetical protein VGH60_09720 [Solirubrobacteraceae bacterium]